MKTIRHISQNDISVAKTTKEYGVTHKSLEMTGSGYSDERFQDLTVQYHRVSNGFTYMIVDIESENTWMNETPTTLKDCGRIVGSIILNRFK